MKISSITLVLLVALLSGATGYNNNEKPNVFALILNTSKFWFNFRQTTNALLFYKFLKEHGIPEENVFIIYAIKTLLILLELDHLTFA